MWLAMVATTTVTVSRGRRPGFVALGAVPDVGGMASVARRADSASRPGVVFPTVFTVRLGIGGRFTTDSTLPHQRRRPGERGREKEREWRYQSRGQNVV